MGGNYPVERNRKGQYRHSFVFPRGTEVAIKLLNNDVPLKGKVSTIERYYIVLDVESEGEISQLTLNLGVIQYIKHEYFLPVRQRSPKFDSGDPGANTTDFVFDVGEKIVFVFKDGKAGKGELLGEEPYYIYIKTDKGVYLTVMKSALNYIRHSKQTPKLELGDFYTEEMKAEGYLKPTEYVFGIGDSVTVMFENGKELKGIIADEAVYWILLDLESGKQITVLKSSYVYIKHDVFETKANIYLENKRLRKGLRENVSE